MVNLVLLDPGTMYGAPLELPFLSEQMKKQGYATHMVGKWHIGFHKEEYTPTYRGFDTYFGNICLEKIRNVILYSTQESSVKRAVSVQRRRFCFLNRPFHNQVTSVQLTLIDAELLFRPVQPRTVATQGVFDAEPP